MKVTITRAQNGWILEEERSYEYDEGTYLAQEVFEDDEHESSEYSSACSLANCLWAAFQEHFQTKWTPGIVMDLREKGREEEFMEEYERARADEEDEMAERWHDFGEPCVIGPSPFGDEYPETD